MSLWKRTDEKAKDVVESDALCKKRDKLAAKWPEVQAEWEKIDKERVVPAAAAVSVAQVGQNLEKLIEAREIFKRATWDRDGGKSKFRRDLEDLNSEIEVLNAPVIAEKSIEWQAALGELRSKKVVTGSTKHRNMADDRMPRMVNYRSNLETLATAKTQLLEAIRVLRDMRTHPLSEVHAFIEKVETQMKQLDFSEMKESLAPVSESRYIEIISNPEVQKLDTGPLSRLAFKGL